MFGLIILVDEILNSSKTKTWHWLSGGPWYVFQKKRQNAKPELIHDFFSITFTCTVLYL